MRCHAPPAHAGSVPEKASIAPVQRRADPLPEQVDRPGETAFGSPAAGGHLGNFVEVPVRAPNRMGLPDPLKAGLEALSGFTMDDVRVHRNSSEPAKLGALAFTRGSDIHLGPGQERHLPHEAWHVVQQKRDGATPSVQLKAAVSSDTPLEREADTMAKQVDGGRKLGEPYFSYVAAVAMRDGGPIQKLVSEVPGGKADLFFCHDVAAKMGKLLTDKYHWRLDATWSDIYFTNQKAGATNKADTLAGGGGTQAAPMFITGKLGGPYTAKGEFGGPESGEPEATLTAVFLEAVKAVSAEWADIAAEKKAARDKKAADKAAKKAAKIKKD